MKFNLFSLIILCFSYSCSAQEPLDLIKTNYKNSGYGKLLKNKLVFMDIDSRSNSMRIGFIKDINELSNEIVLKDITFSPPINWINDNLILLLNSNKNELYSYDVENKSVVHVLKDEEVKFSSSNLASDENIVVFYPYFFDDKKLKSYKYNIETGKREIIKELTGLLLTRISYNKDKDIYAFSRYDGKSKLSTLNLLFNNKVTEIEELPQDNSSDENPMVFSKNGFYVYYVIKQNDISKLFQYEISTKRKKELYEFNNNVRCLDMSYSNNRLLLTLEGTKTADVSESHLSTKDYDVEIEIEIDLSMYILYLE